MKKLNIYFAGSISGGRDDVELYIQLIHHLKKYGDVLTEHVGDNNLAELGEDDLSDNDIHDRDLEWLWSSDVIVAEVTIPSLGVGYEIGRAVENNKKILCLYRPQKNKRLSAMISGCSGIRVVKYKSIQDLPTIFDNYFDKQ